MSTIKLILTIALLAAGVYVGAQIIPPYFANYEFQDALDNEARLGTYSAKGDDKIQDAVFKQAQDLEIPVTRDQIKVQHIGSNGAGSVSIETDYTVHIDLPGYPLDLHFHPESKNKGVF
jgi:hypothetical protein